MFLGQDDKYTANGHSINYINVLYCIFFCYILKFIMKVIITSTITDSTESEVTGETDMRKKLQIFISSTYVDLQEERQAAVEAILASNNIPAGMELFKAGNNSQWDTIKKWINDSDIYMLILGGRYGSIEPNSKKSYTQLEYEYALSINIPVFAVILSEDFLNNKTQKDGTAIEHQNKYLYDEFKNLVMKKMIKSVDDCKDIKLAIFESISELKEENDFEGWTRGISNSTYTNLTEQNASLIKENNELKEQLKQSPIAKRIIEDNNEFWNKVYVLNIHGWREFMGSSYDLQLSITMHDIYMNLAPLMMVPIKLHQLKKNFEEILHEKHASNSYSFAIEENQFQNIKLQIYSMGLITLQNDNDGEENISLTQEGIDTLCRFGNLDK